MVNSSPDNLFSQRRIVSGAHRRAHQEHVDSDFLFEQAAQTLIERLQIINREFPNCADLYSPTPATVVGLRSLSSVRDILEVTDLRSAENNRGPKAVSSPREALDLKESSLELVISVFGLHWSNALPQTFRQIHSALKDDGLLMIALPGAQTLMELRQCLIAAETELTGNMTLRVDPFPEIRQCGELLQKTGFALPVVDSDVVTVRYGKFKSLIQDLRGMGVTSKLSSNRKFPPRNLFQKTEEIYMRDFSDPDGKLRASFEIIYLSGWKPHSSQQRPMKPGSAKNNLKDFL